MSEDNKETETKKTYSRWQTKQKIKKLTQFSLSDSDKFLIRANEKELKDLVIKELNEKITEIGKQIDDLTNSKKTKDQDESTIKKHKKRLLAKLQKLKKCLKDEGGINARVKLLKLKSRKLRSTKNKIDEKLGSLKNSLKKCLYCKKRGHLAEDCPLKKENNNEEGEENDDNNKKNEAICYNCGSKDHGLYQCDKKIDYSNLPFAFCYKCQKKGHISSNCPENENGIYIHGGSCFICKGKDHLAKNCPQKQAREEAYKSKKVDKKKNNNK